MGSISSVQDPITGSNYGGIKKDSTGMNTQYREYLNNLLETTRRPVMDPMRQEQYTPSAGKSPVIGQVSSQTLGSMPIFGAGGAVFPQAILDNFERAKQDAELKYLNEIGDVSMDTFKLEITLKNPWHNQAFSSKYQNALDTWLDASASHFGGDYMKGMKALQVDKDFLRMMKSYEDYGNIYNSVFESAIEILSADPKDTYVSGTTRKSAQKFIHDYENLDDLPIDELVRRARTFKTHVSINKVADTAMSGFGERVTEGFYEAANMSTDEMNAYVKKTKKGATDAEIKELYNLQLEAYPWINDDSTAKKLLWVEMKKRTDKSYEVALSQIKKDTVGLNTYMKKNGINVDADGKVQTMDSMDTMFSKFERGLMGQGTDGIQYPSRDMNNQPVRVNPVPGTIANIMVPNDQGDMELFTVALPGAFTMIPQKEYSTSGGAYAGTGRHVEGIINFEDEGLYAREFTKTSTKEGVISDPVGVGGRTTTRPEKQPIKVKDINTGNMISLYGDYQVVIPFNSVQDELNTAYPFLQRTHADMEQKIVREGFTGTGQTTKGKEVQIDKPGGITSNKPVKINTSKDDPSIVADYVEGQEFEVDGVMMVKEGDKLVVENADSGSSQPPVVKKPPKSKPPRRTIGDLLSDDVNKSVKPGGSIKIKNMAHPEDFLKYGEGDGFEMNGVSWVREGDKIRRK